MLVLVKCLDMPCCLEVTTDHVKREIWSREGRRCRRQECGDSRQLRAPTIRVLNAERGEPPLGYLPLDYLPWSDGRTGRRLKSASTSSQQAQTKGLWGRDACLAYQDSASLVTCRVRNLGRCNQPPSSAGLEETRGVSHLACTAARLLEVCMTGVMGFLRRAALLHRQQAGKRRRAWDCACHVEGGRNRGTETWADKGTRG